jgi:hypothetical protein
MAEDRGQVAGGPVGRGPDGAPSPGFAPGSGATRRAYVSPRIDSGEAFERVQLASGCDFGVFDGCEVPCDE